MMLTALQTNPGSSVFALHSNSSSSSAQQQDQTNQTPHINGIAAQCAMNKSSTPPPAPSSSSSATNNYQGLTPQLIPMATVPPPHVLIGPGGGYTILPSITSLSGTDATTFGNLASLHPITGGFAQASANTIGVSTNSSSPVTSIQAAYYPNSHHLSPPTPAGRGGEARSAGAALGSGDLYQNPRASPAARQLIEVATTAAASSNSPGAAVVLQHPTAIRTEQHTPRSGTGPSQSRLIQNGNQTTAHGSPDAKPSMNSLLLQQQLQQQQANSAPLRLTRATSNGVLTSSSSDPSLHHSTERLFDPGSEYDSGSRRSSHHGMHLGGGAAPIEIKREPEETNSVLSCGRRHSDSSNCADVGASATNISLGSTTAAASKNSPYPVSALIDVPLITPLNRSSRTSSLSSSLSSFRFGGSLSQLWASQISLSGKISNMKSTGNLNAEAATMPSLGNQYFAFGGSLPELSLTSLTRLLPNSSANDPNISSCPSLFTLFHPPLYVYPSQQHLTTPFINANGSISFGSFLSSGTSLCSVQKSSSGATGTAGPSTLHQVISSSSSAAAARSATNTAATSSSTIITGKENKVDDSPGAYGRSPIGQQQQGGSNMVSQSDAVKLSTMYSPISAPIIGGAQVITALPGFGTIATARGFPDPSAQQQQSHSSSIASHGISTSTLSNLTPLYSTAIAPTSTVSHAATPTCNLNTLACVATAQMQQQQQGMSTTDSHPHHLPITHPSTDPHLHQPHQPHHAAATTPTPTGSGALGGAGSATTPTHDSKEGILAAMHGGPPRGTAIEVYSIGGNTQGLIPGAVNVNHIELKGDHTRMTQSPVDMSQGHEVTGSLMPMDMSQPHLQAQQQSAVSPSSGMKMKKEKDKPYKCDHPGCGRSFSFPAHLRSHIQQIHISYRPCKCEFPGCGKRFYTPQHLNVHRRVHTGERPFICPYADCGKAFTTAGNLKNHIRTHTGERPYACKYDGCLKRFAEMSSLKKHELTHTGEKPYKCRVCGKAFSQAGSRNTHERKHNPVGEEIGEVASEASKGSRRYRIKRVPVVANGTGGITSPGSLMEDTAMQH